MSRDMAARAADNTSIFNQVGASMSEHQQYGLLGWPVTHSVSPQMQEAGFAAAGIDARYVLLPTPPDEFTARVAELQRDGYRGWNITVPHKGAMFDVLDDIEPVARAAGSVNTVVNVDGRLSGYSTDGYGLEMAIRRHFPNVALPTAHLLFWGTGGAARATATHFAALGVQTITLVNRTVAKAFNLAKTLRQLAPQTEVVVRAPTDELALTQAMADVDVVVQCTSIGLHPDEPVSIPEAVLRPGLNVMDMIYRRTALLEVAEAMGCNVADGREMLLYQGVRSWSLWTGKVAPVDAMRDALYAALSK